MIRITLILLFATQTIFSQINYSSFKGNELKTSINLELTDVFFKEYGNNFTKKYEEIAIKNDKLTNNTPENLLILINSVSSKTRYNSLFISPPKPPENKLINYPDTLKNKLRLIHRLTFSYNESRIGFLKYLKFRDSINFTPEILVAKKIAKERWIVSNKNDFKEVSILIKKIKTILFWEFFNKNNNPNYPEINKLKPLVKDANGVLNIEKLAKVIEENKSSLAKYLD